MRSKMSERGRRVAETTIRTVKVDWFSSNAYKWSTWLKTILNLCLITIPVRRKNCSKWVFIFPFYQWERERERQYRAAAGSMCEDLHTHTHTHTHIHTHTATANTHKTNLYIASSSFLRERDLCPPTNIWCGLVFPPQTVPSRKHPTQKHAPVSSALGSAVVDRVLGIDAEVEK